ncbi:Splicing factor-like protein [Parasponia andersonii]|uniref:Splicing factor-like protein n=1 Tax=Parasponia andersonii TaxID=3476 RepID=A0A2P5B8E3_PARAD|nr:Splicing factor-like protein [Parasponia andersonii]
MDFDEYDYLEKTVEHPEPLKDSKETANGGEELVKSADKDRNRSSKRRSDDKDDDREHRSRRSKSGEESRDHDRHKERGLSRNRSRSRDGERDRPRSSRELKEREDKDKNKEERNGKERDRERRERDREGDRERDKDKERERSRRSRSHSERHRSDRDEMERSVDREHRERDREREVRERERESRRYKDKKEEVVEPEVDPERDQRTVFAYQVRDVRLIMDRNSRRSKGVGYIEFYDVMSVPMAIALSGQPLLGQPVMVKPSEAEKNLVQSTATVAAGPGGLIGPYSGGARRLYVGNLHANIKEEDLRQVFGAFGPVELVQLPVDETGHCKGFGFVQFSRLEDARNSLSLNGQLEIGGRTIKVSAVTDQAGIQDVGGNTGDFDDDDGSGLALNARSRALLMQKLDRSGTATSITGSLGTPAVNSSGFILPTPPILGATPVASPLATPLAPIPAPGGLQAAAVTVPSLDTIGVPSECLLLKNMFDPTTETEPDFDLDIKEDVREECSKFGSLKHIHVDKNSAGFVYLRFENTQSAMAAQRALHGRWFAGKMITATYMLPQNYEDKFPESR